MLTVLRCSAHFVVSVLMALLYCRIGNDAALIYNNAGLLIFNMFFGDLTPTAIKCLNNLCHYSAVLFQSYSLELSF